MSEFLQMQQIFKRFTEKYYSQTSELQNFVTSKDVYIEKYCCGCILSNLKIRIGKFTFHTRMVYTDVTRWRTVTYQ